MYFVIRELMLLEVTPYTMFLNMLNVDRYSPLDGELEMIKPWNW